MLDGCGFGLGVGLEWLWMWDGCGVCWMWDGFDVCWVWVCAGCGVGLGGGLAKVDDKSVFPRSGELRMQKLKFHLLRTQSLKALTLKPGVDQYIAMHATLTARNFFLA